MAPKKQSPSKEPTVPSAARPVYDTIVALTDAFCREHLAHGGTSGICLHLPKRRSVSGGTARGLIVTDRDIVLQRIREVWLQGRAQRLAIEREAAAAPKRGNTVTP